MFNCELPCDWSVNRRPNSQQQQSTIQTENCNGENAENNNNKVEPNISIGGEKDVSNNKDDHANEKRYYHKSHSAIGTSTSGGDIKDNNPTKNTKECEDGGDNSTNTKKDDSLNNSDPMVLANVLGPRSNILSSSQKMDNSFGNDIEGNKLQQYQRPLLPGCCQIKQLVVQHLKSASLSECLDPIEIQHRTRVAESYLDTESMLSKLPYKKMLSDMFGGNLRGHLQTSCIPYVTRTYEEAFMHEPLNSSERECAKGKMCECMFIDRSQPFICVEFLLPGEKPPRTPHLCVLCCRAITQQLYYDVIFDKCEFPGTIQRFGNIHSEPGEYSLDAMLIASPTSPVHIMPLPIVCHQRNRYSVTVVGGIKRLKQSRVYFHFTPSCSADNGL